MLTQVIGQAGATLDLAKRALGVGSNGTSPAAPRAATPEHTPSPAPTSTDGASA